MVVIGSLWLLVCSVWTGFLRRQSYRILCAGMVLNAVLVASLGFVQQLTGATRIFWVYQPSNVYFVASFIYRNHAGAYFNLMVALAAGMTLRHFVRMRRRLESPIQTVLFAFGTVLLAVMVVFSYSRMAIVLLLVLTVLLAGLMAIRLRRNRGMGRHRRRLTGPILAGLGMLLACLISLRSEILWKRFASLIDDPTASLQDRALVRRASEDMLADHWFFGWGAGCFRYGFPIYAQHYPTIYRVGPGLLRYWEHAHDDLLEFPIEYGAIGMIPILVMVACAGIALARRKIWRHPLPLCAVFGCVLVLVHAWLDFVFQCPAVLLSWSILLVAAVRFADLEPSTDRHVSL